MPNQYLISNFVGASNNALNSSDLSNRVHKHTIQSPKQICLTDIDLVDYYLQVIMVHTDGATLTPTIQMKVEDYEGTFYFMFSHNLQHNQTDDTQLTVECTRNYFTFSYPIFNMETKKFGAIQYNKFKRWKQDYVDNVPQLNNIIAMKDHRV